jgi:uncharacterized damage-inducible protein DinB
MMNIESNGVRPMTSTSPSLLTIYDGWAGHQLALVNAVAPLTAEQLGWRAAPQLRTTGDLILHIALGRVNWIHDILGVESAAVDHWLAESTTGPDSNGQYRVNRGVRRSSAALVAGLNATWEMIEAALSGWTVEDLSRSFQHPYQGKTYVVPYRWVLWRIMAHDIHHGGELAFALGMQGISIPDLGDQGGHLAEVEEATESSG